MEASTLQELMTVSAHVRQAYRTPRQIGPAELAGITSDLVRRMSGRTSITKVELLAEAKAALNAERPGWNFKLAYQFVSYEGAGKEAAQVAFQMNSDPTIYLIPSGMAIVVTTPTA
jgi:hypothetical protein